SIVVYSFLPDTLAHGGLITSDMTAAVAFLGMTAAGWRLFHRVTFARTVLLGVTAGLLAIAKFSAPLLVPILLVMMAVRLAWGGPLPIGSNHRVVTRRLHQAAWMLGATAAAGIMAVTIVWS